MMRRRRRRTMRRKTRRRRTETMIFFWRTTEMTKTLTLKFGDNNEDGKVRFTL